MGAPKLDNSNIFCFYDRMQITQHFRTPAFYRIKWTTRTTRWRRDDDEIENESKVFPEKAHSTLWLISYQRMWFWSNIFEILRNPKVDLHLPSFVLSFVDWPRHGEHVYTNLRYYNDEDLEHHFVCGLFRFGRNSVNNWLFSLLSFDGWNKNRLLCIDVLMLHENAAWVSLYYEQCENEISLYHFFRCWIFRGVCVFLKCYVITRLKNPRSNSFNCYILFLLWTVQLNVLRWLNGIGMALCSPESSFVGNKSACLPSPTSHENAWIAAIFSSFEHRANESMFLLIDI